MRSILRTETVIKTRFLLLIRSGSKLSAADFAALQRRLGRQQPQVSLRALASELLEVTLERATQAIHARLDRAIDRLAAVMPGGPDVGLLAEVTNALRIAAAPVAAEAGR